MEKLLGKIEICIRDELGREVFTQWKLECFGDGDDDGELERQRAFLEGVKALVIESAIDSGVPMQHVASEIQGADKTEGAL